MSGRYENRAFVRFEAHPEEPPMPRIRDIDFFRAVLAIAEHRLAPPDIAFAIPAGEALVHSRMIRQRVVDRVARLRHHLLNAQYVGIEELQEFAQRRLAKIPPLGVP